MFVRSNPPMRNARLLEALNHDLSLHSRRSLEVATTDQHSPTVHRVYPSSSDPHLTGTA